MHICDAEVDHKETGHHHHAPTARMRPKRSPQTMWKDRCKGARVQGAGWSSMREEYYPVLEDGVLENPGFWIALVTSGYPSLTHGYRRVPNPSSLWRERRGQELPPVIAADANIAEAVYQSTGVQFRICPEPTRLWPGWRRQLTGCHIRKRSLGRRDSSRLHGSRLTRLTTAI